MSDLFTPATRSSDPPTSREAAETVAPAVGTIRETVLAFALDRGTRGFIDDDLVRTYCEGSPESSYRKRRSELAQEGFLVDTGEVRTNRFGNNEIVWVHRDFAARAPAIQERISRGGLAGLKAQAIIDANFLDREATSLRKEGRAMFAEELRRIATSLRALAR